MLIRIGIALLLGAAASAAVAADRVVTRADLGDKWPLTIDSGTLQCRPFMGSLQILTIKANGKTWAVNDTAIGQGFPEMDPIRKDDPAIRGARIDTGPLLDLAKSLCQ